MATKKKQESSVEIKAPACGTFTGIAGVQLTSVRYEFVQELDTNDRPENICQELKVFTEDSGGGAYIVIETSRWAIDPDQIDLFAAMLKRIVNTPEEL